MEPLPIKPRAAEFHLTAHARRTTVLVTIHPYLSCHGSQPHRPAMSQSQPHAQRQHIPRLANLVHSDDDWTGLTDAAARRKRQNRLNVRAHRTFSSSINMSPQALADYNTQANEHNTAKPSPQHMSPPKHLQLPSPTGPNLSKPSSHSPTTLPPLPNTLSFQATSPPHTLYQLLPSP
jgi:hypothetical protein